MKLVKTFLFVIIFVAMLYSGDPIIIKFATVAPEGSTWITVMNEFNQAVQEATNGEVKFRIYAGMVQGDEKDVLRKIRINQLQSGGFTGVALGTILPEIRILDSPFLFKNHAEVDYIYSKFEPRFAQNFEKAGFILLGRAEVGFVYVFTNEPVKNVEEFRGIKMWMWEGDPLAEATFKAFNINPIPLSLTDVLTSLQTGMIDGVYTSPLACIATQWYTKTKYMIDVPLTNSYGAVLVSKRIFNKLTPEQQKILKEKGHEYFEKLTMMSREDNKKSIEAMLKAGIQKIEVTDQAELNNFYEVGRKTRQELVGKLYDQQLLDEIESALKEFRAAQNKKE
jgi:TRAP-type C4-dicarboxylate transport system substrate-binding protein